MPSGRCALTPNGFAYQTRQVVAKHCKKWPPGRRIDQSDRSWPANPWQATLEETVPSRQPSLPARPLDLDDFDWRALDYDLDDFYQRSDSDTPDRNDDEPQRPQEPSAHDQRPGPIQDQNYRAVGLPPTRDLGSDQNREDRPSLVPKAFQERPEIRLAYLNSVISNVFGKCSVQEATASLNSTLDSLLVAGVLPEHPRPVRHLISRLGINPDQWITQYTVCPACWKHLTPSESQDLSSPHCSVNETTDSKGRHIREPFKIMPHTSLIGSLRRMFMRPDFAHSLRDSRHGRFLHPWLARRKKFRLLSLKFGSWTLVWYTIARPTAVCR